MVGKKRTATSAGPSGQLAQRKRQAISLDRPTTSSSLHRNRPTTAPPKRSNRPGFNDQDDDSSSSRSDHDDSDDAKTLAGEVVKGPIDDSDDDDERDTERRQALEAALRKHQLQFLQDSNLALGLDRDADEDAAAAAERRAAKGKGKQELKSVWDLGMEDLEDDSDDEDDEADEGDNQVDEPTSHPTAKRVAEVVAFSEPGRSLSMLSGTGTAGGGLSLSGKELRDFKAGKVKSNILAKASVADEANQKYRGKKGGNKAKALLSAANEGVTGSKRGADTPEDAEEETHLAKLDSHLSSLTRSLHSNTSSLPDLLRELPLATSSSSSTKPLKGLTPLPKNAPRSLRSGQNAANLRRARARDDAQGILAGSKRSSSGASGTTMVGGREAKSLKEKRRDEGTDKRERGMGGAVGKFGRGMISLSKGEIARVQGMGSHGGGGGRGGASSRGGGRGGKGGRK